MASTIHRQARSTALDTPERGYVVDSLKRYWPSNVEVLAGLDVTNVCADRRGDWPPEGKLVGLPAWAEDIGVQGELLVPAYTVADGFGPEWERTDWFEAAFWFLTGAAERAFETANGPIHSYSFRLLGWDPRFWERAWVNRIALFLRRAAARQARQEERQLFGELPDAEVILTHDLDAVSKTVAIRCKQTAFNTFNVARAMRHGDLDSARTASRKAAKFLFSFDDYWCFSKIMKLEESYGQRSVFNVYGGRGGWRRSPKQHLFDPAYCVTHPRLRKVLQTLQDGGWTIGLHQSFDAWNDADAMLQEKNRLESLIGRPVRYCRQHWLRFSWQDTWNAQQAAGLERDATLGFNDRPAFRGGCALTIQPWQPERGAAMRISIVPMVLMDSHLYDYNRLDEQRRHDEIAHWLGEVRAVGGTASIVWHQRVMSKDYGWAEGYRTLLAMIGA